METSRHLLLSYFQLSSQVIFVKHGRHIYCHMQHRRLPSQLGQATVFMQVRDNQTHAANRGNNNT